MLAPASGAWKGQYPGRVRLTDFWARMRTQFGDLYAQSVAKDYVFDKLGGRTIERALADGVDPKVVWRAVVDTFDVPQRLRLKPAAAVALRRQRRPSRFGVLILSAATLRITRPCGPMGLVYSWPLYRWDSSSMCCRAGAPPMVSTTCPRTSAQS
jgi:hypothetical protein